MNHLQTQLRQIRSVHSQSKEWEIGYFYNQYHGLAELACSETRQIESHRHLNVNTIAMAREMRNQLLERFSLCCFGVFGLMHLDGTPFSFDEVRV